MAKAKTGSQVRISRRTSTCGEVPTSGCGGAGDESISQSSWGDFLSGDPLQLLKEQNAIVPVTEQIRFVNCLVESVLNRAKKPAALANTRGGNHIIGLIHEAREAGNRNEMAWRAFLAAHIGRLSANPHNPAQVHSAAWFLCAFGDRPVWTWRRVRANWEKFEEWLYAHTSDLRRLAYGNHRKRESKLPSRLIDVIGKFVALAREAGGPFASINFDDGTLTTPGQRFEKMYRRFRKLWRFRRLGSFDSVELLAHLKIVDAEPGQCYIDGASGPLDGAYFLWGDLETPDLDRLSKELATILNVSPGAVEDALCNWQK